MTALPFSWRGCVCMGLGLWGCAGGPERSPPTEEPTALSFETLAAGAPLAFSPGGPPQRQDFSIPAARALWGAQGDRAVLVSTAEGGKGGGEVLDLSTGAVLATVDRPREVSWTHQRLTTRPTGETFDTLVDLRTGAVRRPQIRLAGEAALLPDAAVISIEGAEPVVLARGPDGRGWYGPLGGAAETVELRGMLPAFPQGAGVAHRGQLEVWTTEEGLPSAGDGSEETCVRWRLEGADAPQCVAETSPQPALQRVDLSDGWMALETWSDGIRVYRDSQQVPWRPPPTVEVPADCAWKLAAAVISPPRFLAECQPDRGAPERYRALWSPDTETLLWSRALPPSERGLFHTRTLPHPILSEPIPGISPTLAMRWVDLGRRRGWRTPPLLPLSMDASPEPVLAREPETGRVALLDLDIGVMHALLGVGEDCPLDLIELDRVAGWSLLSCRIQPQLEAEVFRQLFAVVLDLEGRRAWRLEEQPEALLSDGRLLVSDREEDRAEQRVPFTRLALLTFPR